MNHQTKDAAVRARVAANRRAVARNYRLTKDPQGPQMQRLDLLLSRETFAMFEAIKNNMNWRQREALHAIIRHGYEQLVPTRERGRPRGV